MRRQPSSLRKRLAAAEKKTDEVATLEVVAKCRPAAAQHADHGRPRAAAFSDTSVGFYACLAVFGFGLLVILLSLNEIRLLAHCEWKSGASEAPIAWLHRGATLASFAPLFHVERVLRHMGFAVAKGSEPPKWHLLWSHDFPFGEAGLLPLTHRWLAADQRVNHLPGIGYVTSKLELASAFSNASFLPTTFAWPKQAGELRALMKDQPRRMWVEKSATHRNIRLVNVSELLHGLDSAPHPKEQRLIQSFIGEPLLIDGRKFDIGVYVLVTSLRPLRVYIYDHDLNLRFCRKPYDPSTLADIETYVIADHYTSSWDIPSLRPLLHTGFSYKAALAAHMRAQGANFALVWRRIRAIIAEVFGRSASKMAAYSSRLMGPPGCAFDLLRFDFLLDSRGGVHLLEANLSPNMGSGYNRRNAPLFETVLFNAFSLLGLHSRSRELEIGDNDLAVRPGLCANCSCSHRAICGLCVACLATEARAALRLAAMEHLNRRHMRRLWPLPSDLAADVAAFAPSSPEDDLLGTWVAAKCEESADWCS